MFKKSLKAILKYPLMGLNRLYIFSYFKLKKSNPKCKEINIEKDDSILVLSPHVDDETIGLGGTIIKYSKRGSDMTLIYLTDGSGSTSNKSKQETIEERRQEGMTVKDSYGFRDLYFLDEVDGHLNSNDEGIIEKLREIIDIKKPNVIFAPFLIDANRDHIETTKILSKALEGGKSEFEDIYLYQVNSLIDPKLVNTISLLDDYIYKGKKEKYTIFKSQWAMGFSIYDLMEDGRGVNYKQQEKIEAFVKINQRQLKHGINCLENNDYNPEDFKQISSEFTFLPGMLKNHKKKTKYNSILIELLEK